MINPKVNEYLTRIYNKHKRLPTASQLAQKLSITELEASHILGEFSKPATVQRPKAVQVELPFHTPDTAKANFWSFLTQLFHKPQVVKSKYKVEIVHILKLLCYLVAIASLSWQMEYVYKFFESFGVNAPLGAFVMVAGGITLFEVGIYLFRQGLKWQASPLFLIAFLLLGVDIIATSHGLYLARTKTLSTAQKEMAPVLERKQAADLRESKRTRLMSENAQLTTDIAGLGDDLHGLEVGSALYNTTTWKKQSKENTLKANNVEITKIETEAAELGLGITTQRKDYFQSVSDATHISLDTIEKGITFLPSLLLGVIALLSWSFAIFLKK